MVETLRLAVTLRLLKVHLVHSNQSVNRGEGPDITCVYSDYLVNCTYIGENPVIELGATRYTQPPEEVSYGTTYQRHRPMVAYSAESGALGELFLTENLSLN